MNTDAKICNNCQYFRDLEEMRPATLDADVKGFWCSNSKSKYFMKLVVGFDTCEESYKDGQKAPLGMRAAINIVSAAKKLRRKK